MTLLDLIQAYMAQPTASQQYGQQFQNVQQQGGVPPQMLQQQVRQQMFAQPQQAQQQAQQQSLLQFLRMLGGQ
jgi:hypothetical protein